MDISYLGHSCFRIKSKTGTVVMDPFDSSVGLSLPSPSADIVTVSHGHLDHNNTKIVSGTARRKDPFVISEPGEYEIEGVSVFGYSTYHDDKKGEERGENIVFVVQAEGIRVVHLGDLGHNLSEKMIEMLDGVDILLVPVGGVYTIDAKIALDIIENVGPYVVIPMHYRTKDHDAKVFGDVAPLEEFVSLYGGEVREIEDDKYSVSRISLSEDATEVVVFK